MVKVTVKAVMVTVKAAWVALLVALLTPTQHAHALAFNPEDLLSAPLDLTRSGTPSTPCRTPDNQQGVCGSAISCQQYAPLLTDLRNKTVLAFFRERVCRQAPGLIHVCCALVGPPEGPTPIPDSLISFNQPPRGSFHRPSQRPNARQPGQGGFREDQEEEEEEEDKKIEFVNGQPMPSLFPPQSHRPLPPSTTRPSTRLTTTTTPTTTQAPNHFISQPLPPPSIGILSSERGPIIQNNSAPVSQGPPITEPPAPSILPSERECGVTSQGSRTPWAVGVGVLDKGGFQVVCGGALISHLHVIIAAHCLHTPAPTHVRLGNLQQGGATLQDVQILTWVHPKYEAATRSNDLALLTLATPVSFTDDIKPVCLPFPYRLDGFVQQQMQVVGWGGGGNVEEGSVQVVGLGECRKAYRTPSPIANNQLFSRPSSTAPPSFIPRAVNSVAVDRRHLCGSPAPSSSSSTNCLSDHGAPLFYHDLDTTGRHFLVGVSSMGEGCGAGPGLYTRIGAFLPWLAKQLSTVNDSTQRPAAPSPATSSVFQRRNVNHAHRNRG